MLYWRLFNRLEGENMNNMSSMPGMVNGEMGSGIKKPMYPKQKLPSGYKVGSVPVYNQMQRDLDTRNYEQLAPGSYLDRLSRGDQSIYDEIEAPAMRDFQGLQSQIASRFSGGSGRGSLGSRHSSGFQNTMNQAGSNFLQDLTARRHDLRRQAIGDIQSMSNELLSRRPDHQFLYGKQPSSLSSFLSGLAPLAGAGIGGFVGGLPGATAGFHAGNSFMQNFYG